MAGEELSDVTLAQPIQIFALQQRILQMQEERMQVFASTGSLHSS